MGGRRTDGILCILGRLKHDRPTSFGASIDADIDVRADDGTRMAEEVLDVLPTGLVGQLWICDASVTPSNSLLESSECEGVDKEDSHSLHKVDSLGSCPCSAETRW